PRMLRKVLPSCGLIDQDTSVANPAGKASLKLTPVAVPVPSLVSVTVKLAVPPALTVAVLVLLVMSTSGAVRLTVAVADWFCSAVVSLAALMLAVLTSVPLKAPALPSGAVSSAKTVAVTVTVWLSVAVSAVGLKTRCWLPVAPLMLKALASCVLIDQETSLASPAGNRSLKLTPVAVPLPSLVSVTVKLAVPPALTVAVLVLLVMSTSGAVRLTVAVADWFCSAVVSLAAVMLAVLTSVPLKAPALPSGAVSSAKTVAVTVTVWLSLAVSLVGLRTRCWLPVAPLMLKALPSCELIDQETSPLRPAGKASLKLTPVAVPVPSLVSVTVKLAVPPALTVAVLVLLVMSTS